MNVRKREKKERDGERKNYLKKEEERETKIQLERGNFENRMFIARSNIFFFIPWDEITIAVGAIVTTIGHVQNLIIIINPRRFDYLMVAQNISSKFRSSACWCNFDSPSFLPFSFLQLPPIGGNLLSTPPRRIEIFVRRNVTTLRLRFSFFRGIEPRPHPLKAGWATLN